MCSEFSDVHSSGLFPLLTVTDTEYSKTIRKYSHLYVGFNVLYGKNSASTSMNVGGDNYFDNENVLKQFEYSFQLLLPRKEYENLNFACLVGNSKTHIATKFNINDFDTKLGTKCAIDKLEFIDENNVKKIIGCSDNNDASKRLLALVNELNIFVPKKCSRQELRLLLTKRVAFKKVKTFALFNSHHCLSFEYF